MRASKNFRFSSATATYDLLTTTSAPTTTQSRTFPLLAVDDHATQNNHLSSSYINKQKPTHEKIASEGARISIVARNTASLSTAADSIRLSTGIEVSTYSADVRDYYAVKKVVEKAGEIDVVIVNAEVFVPEELVKQDLEEVKMMLDVNLLGSFNLVKAALLGMKRRKVGGRAPRSIAFMSSQAGQVGIYGYTAYLASKFGLRGLAEALQQEVFGDDIYVSLVFPPDTDTSGLAEGMK